MTPDATTRPTTTAAQLAAERYAADLPLDELIPGLSVPQAFAVQRMLRIAWHEGYTAIVEG
jgi:hypothetical protein